MKKKYSISYFMFILILILTGCTTNQPNRIVTPTSPSMISSTYERADVDYAITTSDVIARSSLNINSETLYTITNGTTVKVLGKIDGLYVVLPSTNQIGLIPISNTTPAASNSQSIPETPGSPVNTVAAEESTMISLINDERAKSGAKPLTASMELTKIARLKSKDIVDKNYFNHNSPTYGSPFEMMKKFGIAYLYAGENLAMDNSVKSAHLALMDSAGHKKNILNPDFTQVGIGIISKDNKTKIYTQMFIGR